MPVNPIKSPIPQLHAKQHDAPLEKTAICAWVFNNSARLVYQDAQGDLRQAESQPKWHATDIPTTARARIGSPLTLVAWADQVYNLDV